MDNFICNNDYSFDDNNFRKIFDFFVIKTPVEGVSYKGISFKKRNFKNANEVLNKMKKQFLNLFLCFENIEEGEDIEEKLKMNGITNNLMRPFEFSIFKLHDKLNITNSFFYYIRCALAHGSFCIHEYENIKYYYFENTHKEKWKHKPTLNARMIIKEETLLGIIELCNSKI